MGKKNNLSLVGGTDRQICPKGSCFGITRQSLTEAVLTSTHNLCFRAKIRKNVYPGKPHFSYKKWGVRGYTLQGHVFMMATGRFMRFLTVASYLTPPKSHYPENLCTNRRAKYIHVHVFRDHKCIHISKHIRTFFRPSI